MPELHIDEDAPDYSFAESFEGKLQAAAEAATPQQTEPEPEPEPQPEPSPEAPPAAADDRPRNADGTFAPRRSEGVEWARQRYGSDLSDVAAQSLWEKEQQIARQGNELGELRRVAEQLQQLPQQLAAQNYDWDQAIEADPAAAAMAAFQSGDQLALNNAVQAWEQLSPGAPALWAQNIQTQAQQMQLYEQQQQIQQHLVAQQAQQAAAQWGQRHPDWESQQQAMLEIGVGYPFLAQTLASGDPAAQHEVLDFLYEKARSRNADTVAQAQQTATAEQADANRQSKLGAATASAAQTAVSPTPGTPGEAFLQALRQQAQARPSILSGITTD